MSTFNPYSQVPDHAHLPGEATHSLQDVRNWLDEPTCHLAPDTSLAYRRAIDRCSKILEKAPKDIIADRRNVLASLPISNYNSSWAKNTSSAKRLLRNLGCAINSALGAKARKQELRAANDRWNQLIGALHDHLQTSDQPFFSEKKLIAINVMADVARANDIDSHELDTAACKTIMNAAAHSKQRKTLKEALKFIAFLQSSKSLSFGSTLPAAPVVVLSGRQNNVTSVIPLHFQGELQDYVCIAAKGIWSETDGDFVENLKPEPFEKAVKKVVATLAQASTPNLAKFASVSEAFDKKHLITCVQIWRKWYIDCDPRALNPVTANGYFDRLAVLLDKNGACSEACRSILKTDRWMTSITTESSKMTQKTREFCRCIVTNKSERLRLLTLHILMRKKAQFHLDQISQLIHRAKKNPKLCREYYLKKKLKHEIKARQYGTCAAFAAIEIICPVRVSNAREITYRGTDRWLNLNVNGSGSGHLFIPGKYVKSNKDISAPILTSNKLRPLDTLRWYEINIRPLFEMNANSNHFFPALKLENKCIPYQTLRDWWDSIVVEFGFPSLTPHMFRHTQASILVARRPGNWPLISVRLGDKEATCKAYYAWIDQEGLMLEGQNILAEEFLNVA